MMSLKVADPEPATKLVPAFTILTLLATYSADSLPVPHFVSVSAAIAA
jgi:hypothetical protein